MWVPLTEEREQHRVVVRHDKEIDTRESGAGFQVTERLAQVVLLPAAANEHLRDNGSMVDNRAISSGSS